LATLDERFWELKESAKWSLDVRERRQAIEELASSYGRNAIEAISEIKDVSAYDEIRNACIAAIKSASRADPRVAKKRRKGKASSKIKGRKSKKRRL